MFAAIVAVGTNITYGVWIGRAKRDPASLPFALRGVKFLDDRVANPCYGLLVLTGFAMVGVSKMPLTTPWVLMAIGLVLVVFAVAIFGYTPTLRRQIEALDRGRRLVTPNTWRSPAAARDSVPCSACSSPRS